MSDTRRKESTIPTTLLYHDVIPDLENNNSGFSGAGALRYKFSRSEFAAHMACISDVAPHAPIVAEPQFGADAASEWVLTFDDGGISAYSEIAGVLEGYGWRGHFFVTTDYIGKSGFMEPDQIRALKARGHVIGSHSCSHPARMSACNWTQLVDEWSKSRDLLSDILGESVVVGSVPGGYYSSMVASAAARAGLRVLFTSEPTARCWLVDGCQVLGRYTLYRGMPGSEAQGIVAGALFPRLRQKVLWSVKKVAKVAGGQVYIRIRDRVLTNIRKDNAPL